MSDDPKPIEAQEPEAAIEHPELQMYKDYLKFMSIEDIATKYGMSAKGVYKIANNNKWRHKRNKAKELAYKTLGTKYKEQIVDIVIFIERDMKFIMEKCVKENRPMDAMERAFLMTWFDKSTKEQKLIEGKPTEITDGNHTVQHVVVLPPGVKRFGVIPPAANVTQIEAKEVKEEEPTPEEKIEYDSDEP